MKVLRNYEKDVKKIQMGDKIQISLPEFGDFTATAQKIEGNHVLFLFDECVAERAMNKTWTNKGGANKSSLYKWFKDVLLPAFPDEIRDRIQDLRLPTYGMMFGHDDFYKNFEEDTDEQLPLMKIRKNRIADFDNQWTWCWLENATKQEVSSEYFALVDYYGDAYYDYASCSCGVRPCFWLVME